MTKEKFVVPEGWKMVPEKPTPEMKEVFDEYHSRQYNPRSTYRCEHTWDALLEVSPEYKHD